MYLVDTIGIFFDFPIKTQSSKKFLLLSTPPHTTGISSIRPPTARALFGNSSKFVHLDSSFAKSNTSEGRLLLTGLPVTTRTVFLVFGLLELLVWELGLLGLHWYKPVHVEDDVLVPAQSLPPFLAVIDLVLLLVFVPLPQVTEH